MTESRQTTISLLGALAVLLSAVILSGCGATNPYPPGSYDRAQAFQENGKHHEAVAAYSAFLRRSPTDSLAAQAQFEKAMSYMAVDEFPLAAVELQILRQEYPTSDLVERAVFEEANAFYSQVGRVERDITPAYDARYRYQAFLESYPASVYHPEARERIIDISDMVVLKRLKQLSVYERLGREEAVAVTLDRLIEAEPLSRLRPEVMLRRARLARDTRDHDTARDMAARIMDEYPVSAEAAAAADLARELPAETGPSEAGS